MYKHFNTTEGPTAYGSAFAVPNEFRGHRGFHPHSAHRKAPVSVYKTENSYEILVFAPGRVKENFNVKIVGEELVISYKPTDDTSHLNWVRKEYSRGGFERSFLLDNTLDTENIIAKYEDGVLKISLTIKPGSEPVKQEVKVS